MPRTDTVPATAYEHECAQAGCPRKATHLVVEINAMVMLLRDGAGLLCRKCARSMEPVGGVVVPITPVLKLAERYRRAPSN